MKDIIDKIKVSEGKSFLLQNHDPGYAADLKKEDADAILEGLVKQIIELQPKLYADKRYALLVLFQAMDAGGKDSAILHTLSGLNPQGCEVHSFKQPSVEELSHDFLWRHHKAMPEFGHIGVHNRSHYENVLITKVHPELLLNERLPGIDKTKNADKQFWEQRYGDIRAFESYLSGNGTIIIKFFLHVSKDEQKKRFLERINDPTKNWKFSSSDIDERQYFDDYMQAYEKAIQQTSTNQCPWYIIPADKKWFSRIAISTVILQTLKSLKLEYPVLPKAEMERMEMAKKLLGGEN
jgi:PPK2 family polyphosphate:nucleotide phosphotransferase